MQGANEYVRAGQKFLFQCPAALGLVDNFTFTWDDTIRLRIQSALSWAANDLAVSFETDSVWRANYALLKIAGASKMDRAKGYNLRDDCLAAAQSAGLSVNASQSDINIYPADYSVNYNYNNLTGGNDNKNSDDDDGLPSIETMFMLAVGVIIVTKFLRG